MELALSLEVAEKLPWDERNEKPKLLSKDWSFMQNKTAFPIQAPRPYTSSYRNDGAIFGFLPCSKLHSILVSCNQVW